MNIGVREKNHLLCGTPQCLGLLSPPHLQGFRVWHQGNGARRTLQQPPHTRHWQSHQLGQLLSGLQGPPLPLLLCSLCACSCALLAATFATLKQGANMSVPSIILPFLLRLLLCIAAPGASWVCSSILKVQHPLPRAGLQLLC